MNLGGSSKIVMDDCRKSQTLDSLPAKGGGLPIAINVWFENSKGWEKIKFPV